MIKDGTRVSQADLTDVLAKAVALETQRIEALNPEMLDHIAGGFPFDPPIGTAGYFPRLD